MNQLGMGVMIKSFFGASQTCQELIDAVEQQKLITSAELVDDRLLIRFSDGTGVALFDDGQSCCEHRYMTTGDNLNDMVGGYIADIEEADATPIEDDEWGDVHETCFLRIKTSQGTLTLETHNEHNGYYGGFWLKAVPIEAEDERYRGPYA